MIEIGGYEKIIMVDRTKRTATLYYRSLRRLWFYTWEKRLHVCSIEYRPGEGIDKIGRILENKRNRMSKYRRTNIRNYKPKMLETWKTKTVKR